MKFVNFPDVVVEVNVVASFADYVIEVASRDDVIGIGSGYLILPFTATTTGVTAFDGDESYVVDNAQPYGSVDRSGKIGLGDSSGFVGQSAIGVVRHEEFAFDFSSHR